MQGRVLETGRVTALRLLGERGTRSGTRRIEWAGLGLIVLAAFAMRVYKLGAFPDTVLADEADNAQSAVGVLNNQPPANGFFGLDWTQQPALSIYKEAGFIALFGFKVMAIRLSSAVMSTIALIPFYFLLRRQLSTLASALATLLLATEVWYLNFSRSGWNNIDVCLYLLMAMLLLLKALDAVTTDRDSKAKWLYFAGAGFFCALGLYGYPSGRAITLGVVAFLPVALLFWREHWKTLLVGYVVLLAVGAATFAPQAAYIARNWELFNGRSDVVFILNDPAYKADPVGTIRRQVDRNVRAPWQGSVNNTPQYSPVGEPQLSRVTGLLALAGMVFTLIFRRLRRSPATWLWWLMLLSAWTLTQLLTASTPNGARGIVYAPILIYFAGVGLDVLVRGSSHIPAKAGGSSLAGVALVVALVIVSLANVRHYRDWQSKPQTRAGRYLYVTTQEFGAWSSEVVEFAQQRRGVMNVGQWRQAHPIRDPADPYGSAP